MKNLTKTIVISLLFLITGIQVNAQYSYQKAGLLELKSDSLKIDALKSYQEFIIKQDTMMYRLGKYDFADAKKILIDIANNSKDLYGGAQAYSADISIIDVYLSTVDDYTKGQIVDEKAAERTKSVTWNGKEYKLTASSKKDFNYVGDMIKSATDIQKIHQKSYNSLPKK
jgi:hypothetical protein